MTRTILVVDDDREVRDALAQTLELNDFTPLTAGSFIEAKDHLTRGFDGVVLSDIRMPGRDGFHLLGFAHDVDPELPVILLTGEGDVPMAVTAMSQGAFDFLEKPCAPAALVPVLHRALGARALVLENRRLKRQLETGDPAARMLFGTSQPAQDLRKNVRSAARAVADVLVTGPAGAGVSKVAEVLHLMSGAADGPFVKRPSSAMDPAAFRASFADASGGSLFLDEVQNLTTDTQFEVLDHMENGAGTRIIAGSTVTLDALVQSGQFSAELFYRLQVMTIQIPSLAERPEDIPVLFRQYVAQAAEQSGLPAPEITPDHQAALMAKDWPGNARSLMSAAMRFVLGTPDDPSAEAELGLAEQMARVERSLLISALERCAGNATDTARALQLPRKTFYDKLSRHGLRAEDYRR